MTGCASNSANNCTSFSYLSARNHADTRSEPVHTALVLLPDFTDKYPNFKAFIPELHTPDEAFSSTECPPKSPCTIALCEGNSTSGVEVPHESTSITSHGTSLPIRFFTAKAVS